MSRKDDRAIREIDYTYRTTMRYLCPVRGWVSQEVSVHRYKAQKAPEAKTVDSELSELFGGETAYDLEDAGFSLDYQA